MKTTIITPKPFLKWAGGKTQLIHKIENLLPKYIYHNKFTYVEPFVGSGALLFWMLSNFPNLERAIINDINEDLINTYKIIASSPKDLIFVLENLENEYYSISDDPENKKGYYYKKRALFNSREEDNITQAGLFIFLNKTCFNGLYRVNRKNEFNVPIGSYKKPTICNPENILAVHESLKKVEILCGDFEQTIKFANESSLFYFDPPYKPLSKTSSFNSYTKEDFNDDEQIRLAEFCKKINTLGGSWILSNADVKEVNSDDNFFDALFKDFQINRVSAKRSINANPKKRGALKELLITNKYYKKIII